MRGLQRTIIIVSIVAVSVALVVIMIPFGIERYALSWLDERGVPSRDLEDVDFNPFTGTLRFDVARFSGAAGQRGEVGVAELNFQWTGLVGRNLMLSSFALRDARVDVRKLGDGRYSVGGLILSMASDGAEETEPGEEQTGELVWGLGITDVALENVELTYADEFIDSRVAIHRLSVDQLATWKTDVATSVLADLELDGSPVTLRAEVFPFAKQPGGTATLTVEGLEPGRYAAAVQDAGIADVQGALSLDLQLEGRLRENGDLGASVAGMIEAVGFAATLAQATVRSDGMTWSGDLAAELPKNADIALDVAGDTEFKVKDFALELVEPGTDLPSSFTFAELAVDVTSALRQQADQGLAAEIAGSAAIDQLKVTSSVADLSSGQIRWSGDLDATVVGDQPQGVGVSGTTELAVNDFMIDARDQPIRLLAFGELAVSDVNVTNLDAVSIREVSLSALDVVKKRQSDQVALSVAATKFDDLRIADRSTLFVESGRLDTVVVNLLRRADGELDLVAEALAAVQPMPTENVPADEPAPEQGDDPRPSDSSEADAPGGQAFTFHIAKFEIAGESRLTLQDEFVSPPVSTRVFLDKILVENLGTVDPTRPAKIRLDLRHDDTAKLTASGEVWPFGDIASNLELSLSKFDLTQVSSYVPAYNIQRGRLSIDTEAKFRDDTLDVANTLVIEKLKLSAKAGGEQGMLGTGMAMPLDVALDLLRDSDDRIKLNVPVTGSLSDPQFGTGQIMRLAMQGALQKAALSYAKNALQPLGTIMLVASVAGKAARPRFDPLNFAAGLAEITPESAAYLDKIAQLLRERPGLSITFCGVSTLADRDFMLQAADEAPSPDDLSPSGAGSATDQAAPAPPLLESERLELAQSRGSAVQDYFVTNHNVDAERLFRCRPMLDAESVEPPRVEIML